MKYKDYNIQEIVDFLNQKYHFTYDEVDLVFKTPSLELKDKNLKLNHIIDLRDVDTMVILYQKYKVPFYRIAQFYGSTEYKIRQRCLKQTASRHKQTGANSDNRFFQHISTREQAYFLGLWFADGSVVKYRTSFTVSLTLTYSDQYLIEDFLRISNVRTPIYITHKVDKHPRSQININSKCMFEDLINLGCVPDKSHAKHLRLPDIKPELIPDFIRGYYDGDGICYSDGRIGFCGHYDVLLYIYKYINTLLPTPTKTHLNYNKSNNIYYLTYARLSEIKQIVKCIYKDLKDQPFLKRKYKTYRPLL